MNHDFWGPYNHPHLARHAEIKRLERAQSRARKRRSRAHTEVKDQIEELRSDLEFVTLTLATLLTELDHKGTVTSEDVRGIMRAVDEYDGKLDARLPVAALQELLRPPVLEEIHDENDESE